MTLADVGDQPDMAGMYRVVPCRCDPELSDCPARIKVLPTLVNWFQGGEFRLGRIGHQSYRAIACRLTQAGILLGNPGGIAPGHDVSRAWA
ncbi:hypothetical protein [Roseovarius atlanticus]|uniref:hypothetical protein n=1 Tax=Roseovarius atlanticus TaxID=1641875 RepID=UPI001C99C8A8|nr:hypothetical protein [Roseovarius atlanticus]